MARRASRRWSSMQHAVDRRWPRKPVLAKGSKIASVDPDAFVVLEEQPGSEVASAGMEPASPSNPTAALFARGNRTCATAQASLTGPCFTAGGASPSHPPWGCSERVMAALAACERHRYLRGATRPPQRPTRVTAARRIEQVRSFGEVAHPLRRRRPRGEGDRMCVVSPGVVACGARPSYRHPGRALRRGLSGP